MSHSSNRCISPFLLFAAVLAIAPVAGIPPKIGDNMFAAPLAISSMFDLCFSPIIPSATTAESNASIPTSTAIVKAGLISSFIFQNLFLVALEMAMMMV